MHPITKYNIGNIITINDKLWEINNIIYRFGKEWCYELIGKTAVDNDILIISINSLETILD
jgi:hypothetical protein